MGICSIAFPSIPAGVYSYPLGQAAKIAIQTVVKYVQKYNEDFDRVVWIFLMIIHSVHIMMNLPQ
jgi:O-acetyl-ADP-ribose deacetylase (regulator of RNase III)